MASLRFGHIPFAPIAVQRGCNSGAREIWVLWENFGLSPEGGGWNSSQYYEDWGSGARTAEYTQLGHGRDLEASQKNNTLLYG